MDKKYPQVRIGGRRRDASCDDSERRHNREPPTRILFDTQLPCRSMISMQPCEDPDCDLVHKKICKFSLSCNNSSKKHRNEYYHARRCANETDGKLCTKYNQKHFIAFAHKCRFSVSSSIPCKYYSSLVSMGFLCDHHWNLMYKIDRAFDQ